MPKRRVEKIVGRDEVMEFFSSVLKGEEIVSELGEPELPNLAMRFKAAEFLGKCYGMFSDKSSGGDTSLPVIISGEERIER